MSNPSQHFTFLQKILAWLVHLLTASGILAGFMAILAINEKDWQEAMLWLLACQLIDGIDGTFARLFKVKTVLPYMDGKEMDYIIDFATYAIIPAYFFYQTDLVGEEWRLPLTFLILIVSVLYYGKDGMVADEQYFVGFPVLWNLAVFYMVFVFQFPQWANVGLVILLSILHFVPIKFAYPSRTKKNKVIIISVSAIGILTMFFIIILYPGWNLWLTGIMISVMLYFAILGLKDSYFE